MTTVTHCTPAQLVNLCHRLGTEQLGYAQTRAILKSLTFDVAASREPITTNLRVSREREKKLAEPIESRASDNGKPVKIPRDLHQDAPVVRLGDAVLALDWDVFDANLAELVAA